MQRALYVASLFVATVATACGLSPTAYGQQSSVEDQRRERAVELFERSEQLYSDGEFGEAAELLERAYELYEDPTLLFNLARARENEGQLEAAIEAYERYIEAKPDAVDRGAIEKRIARLRQEIAERETLERERSEALRKQREAEEQLEKAESVSRGPLPWLVTGLGVAGVANGIVFGALARSRHDSAVRDPTQTGAASAQSDARTFAKVSTWSFVTGGVVFGAGLVWALVGLLRGERAAAPGSEDDASVRGFVSPGGGGLRLRF